MSMIVASATVLHRSMTYGQSKAFTQTFTTILLVLFIIETVYHATMDEVTVHQMSFLGLIALVAFRTRQLVKQKVSNEQDRGKLRMVTALGAGTYGLRWTDSTVLIASQDAWCLDTFCGRSTSGTAEN